MKEKNVLGELFKNWHGEMPESIELLPISGSNRNYYRLIKGSTSAIGVYNIDKKENIAFIKFTEHFLQKKLNVAQIYAQDLENHCYIQEDLGDDTLFSILTKDRKGDEIPPSVLHLYLKAVEQLPRFQVLAHEGFDYSYCYPRASFDKQSMTWDLNYFKYYFLKLAQIPYDEQSLEDDFSVFAEYLNKVDRHFFLYRDFQSRNIMIRDKEVWFIDYQGGREGALQYDLASLLYDAKANLNDATRELLLEHYLDSLQKYTPINRDKFKDQFYTFALIRILQAMGAYGFRGFYENKSHFLQSIPYALKNLRSILKKLPQNLQIPTLTELLSSLSVSERLLNIGSSPTILTVQINSFSFKKGLPTDDSGNGGGFIFDCRSLPNPGRLPEYKTLTGMDFEVIEYLEKHPIIETFKQHVFSMVDISVQNYLERGFTNLQINFGCTGGQHRSVYFAEELSKHIKQTYNAKIILHHREQQIKPSVI
ncbi:MAG: RNase adapter RapZ [Bacteroidales bacterium]|nr:RNase adapter RapZ [Bacteroidales bacterium]